ncbi:methyl-CpG-binding domain protein 1-like [Ciconia boyciana]|uniref:methyl-CpG-binding domain protein 1-like n=1 Tax=Ciconia boyciana TaxID=52775 RepID=UPI003BA14341
MAEGWEDCPALGPGWKRREAFRKSGATCGRTDTYYQSPTGEKFRSKIELSRFLGPGRDLGNFDFKHGLERSGPPKGRKGPKWRPPAEPPPRRRKGPPLLRPSSSSSSFAAAAAAAARGGSAPPEPRPLLPRRTRKRPPPEPPREGEVAGCAGCQRLFPGVRLPRPRRCRWLCPACRAQRRDFNREQRFFKRVGCGACQACRIPEDCGICSACARPPRPARPKCLLRRCLRIVKKSLGCGSCPGCLATEDCGSCCICLRRLKPGLKRQWRCLRRRCLRPKRSGWPRRRPTAPQADGEMEAPLEREPSAAPSTRHRKQLNKAKEKKKPGRPPKHPPARGGGGRGARSRGSRRCGACEACLRPAGCGRCDFCRDKPKFGGQNLKRQKCRWRQCLRCAMDKEHPVGGAEKGPGPPPGPPPPPPQGGAGTPPPPRGPPAGAPHRLGPRLKATVPEPSVTPGPQEQPQPSASLVPLVVLDESEEEEEEEGGGRVPPSPTTPGLRLVQRSPAPHGRHRRPPGPGLAFRVLVARRRPVPRARGVDLSPPRLRSVDDLVELLCDLEAYRPCPGPPVKPPAPRPRCQVLVPGEVLPALPAAGGRD